MKETIESIKWQFEALSAKIDPLSAEMLRDRDYAMQLADCVAKSYVMLNGGMCSVAIVCRVCARQRDELREAMEWFETVGQTGALDGGAEKRYFEFIGRLEGIRQSLEKALKLL